MTPPRTTRVQKEIDIHPSDFLVVFFLTCVYLSGSPTVSPVGITRHGIVRDISSSLVSAVTSRTKDSVPWMTCEGMTYTYFPWTLVRDWRVSF